MTAALLPLIALLLAGPAPAGKQGASAESERVPMSAPWETFAPDDASEEQLPDGWYARIETSEGSILVLLHPEQAPQSVAYFAALADARLPWIDPITGETRRNRYYDGLLVHRAEAGARFEAGDPQGTGRGAPEVYVPFVRGPMDFSRPWRLGNTRAPLGRISASQFFVTASPDPALSGRHPCFGTVLRGKEVVFRITSVKTYNNGRPIEPVRIESVRIQRKGTPAPLPEPEVYKPETWTLQPRKDVLPPERR